MTLTLWIPDEDQYGEPPAPGSERKYTYQQKIQQQLKLWLFDDKSAEDAESKMREYLVAFYQGIQVPGNRSEALPLWERLMNPFEIKEGEPSPAVAEAFCVALHGLCEVVAEQGFKASFQNDAVTEALAILDDVLEEPSDNNDETETLPEAVEMDDHTIKYAEVQNKIAYWVKHLEWNKTGDDADFDQANQKLIADIWLNALLTVFPSWFEIKKASEKKNSARLIVLQDDQLMSKIKTLVKQLGPRFTVQPLKRPVLYDFGAKSPSSETDHTYFPLKLFGYRSINKTLRGFHGKFQDSDVGQAAIKGYIEAINFQQAVPWRINQALLTVVDVLHEQMQRGGSQIQSPVQKWAATAFYPQKRTERGKKKYSTNSKVLPGQALDNPLVMRAVKALTAEPGEIPPCFYLPWKADYRGRIYPHTPWLSLQGGDLPRSLLEFANGQRLNEKGIEALRRHGAGLVNRTELLEYFAIKDRQVVTLKEREDWVTAHEKQILACAEAPLENGWWCRKDISKPWQFLAFCLAYRQWTINPDDIIHLPVQIDGTCNGLQHIAALTGDSKLAKAVNVLPTEKEYPADIYSELATKALKEAKRGFSFDQDKEVVLLRCAYEWLKLESSGLLSNWINRGTAKKVVMTIPYGAGENKQAKSVLEKIAPDLIESWRNHPIEGNIIEQIKTQLKSKKLAWNLFNDCDNLEFRQGRRALVEDSQWRLRNGLAGQEKMTREAQKTYDDILRILGAYIALLIVKYLQQALTADFPVVGQFSDWLRKVGETSKNLPLLWLSPIGVPVYQNQFEMEGLSRTAGQGQYQVRIDLKSLSEKIDTKKQSTALLPNLIHSMDATHLMMNFLMAKDKGITDIGSIHDCLMCHANQADELAEITRQTFVDLYATDPLSQWTEWMRLLVKIGQVQSLNNFVGAIDCPGGDGEHDLNETDKTLLAELRQKEGTVAYLFAEQLLKYRCGMEQDINFETAQPAIANPFANNVLQIKRAADLTNYFFS